MRDLGIELQRIRNFLDLSQEQVARAAGVSQGAISRLEAARGLATPLLTVVKVQQVLVDGLRAVEPALLTQAWRAMIEADCIMVPGNRTSAPSGVLSDGDLEEVILAYHEVPEPQRAAFGAIVRATAKGLAAGDQGSGIATSPGEMIPVAAGKTSSALR
jgi:DNA-binding XRE family transcriptional regulator